MPERARRERGEVNLLWIVVAVAVVGVIVAVPFVFMGREEAKNVEQGLDAADQASSASAQVALTQATRVAEVYFAEQGQFTGFDSQVAALADPGLTWTMGGPATAGAVSIRGVTPTSIVLVTGIDGGGVLCVADNGGTLVYGRQDAATAAQCTGGLG